MKGNIPKANIPKVDIPPPVKCLKPLIVLLDL